MNSACYCNNIILFLLTLFLISCGGNSNHSSSQSSKPASSSSSSYSSSLNVMSSSSVYSAGIVSLRDHAEFPIGVDVVGHAYPEFSILSNIQEQTNVARHFDEISSNNIFSEDSLHPEPQVYELSEAISLVEYAEKNNLKVHAGPLLNVYSLPNFLKEYANSDPEKFLVSIDEHITTILGFFVNRPNVVSWDVLDGLSRLALYRYPENYPFYVNSGNSDVFIERALLAARRASPNAQLYIRYGDGAGDPIGWLQSQFSSHIYQLKRNGIPLDGITIERFLLVQTSSGNSDIWRNYNYKAVVEVAKELNLKIKLVAVGAPMYLSHFDSYYEALQQQKSRFCYLVEEYLELVPEALRGGIILHASHDTPYTQTLWQGWSDPMLLDSLYMDKPALRGFVDGLNGNTCNY